MNRKWRRAISAMNQRVHWEGIFPIVEQRKMRRGEKVRRVAALLGNPIGRAQKKAVQLLAFKMVLDGRV